MAFEIFLPTELRGQGAEALEDMANRDFEMGAKYGNEVAAEMARDGRMFTRRLGKDHYPPPSSLLLLDVVLSA